MQILFSGNALTVLSQNPMAIHILRGAIVVLVFIGATAPAATSVFFFSDPMMGILALVNLVALTMLFPIGLRLLNDFRSQLKAGIEHPVFDVDKFSDLNVDKAAWADAKTPAAAE